MVTVEEKFWSRVDKNGPLPERRELGNCWMWTGAKRPYGHGHFRVKGIGTSAHQFSYHIHKGPIPEGLYVLHECDNGWCVNPDHLIAGTQKKNMEGCSERGRNERGVQRYNAVLDDAKAVEIYTLYHLHGMTLGQLAVKFGVPQNRISKVKNGLAWNHATKHLTFPRRKGFGGPPAKE